MAWPMCWHHDIMLTPRGYGSMGSFHSNYYSCCECGEGKVICLYDRSVVEGGEYFNTNKGLYGYGLDDVGRKKAKTRKEHSGTTS